MMLYCQTKFGCKWTSSLEDIVEIVIFCLFNPHCDLDIEDSETIFLHDTPPHDNTPPYKVWLRMVEQLVINGQALQEISPGQTRTGQTDEQTDKVIPIYPPS